jgi:hypothetical protein
MLVVFWNFEAILVLWCGTIGTELGLVDHAEELLLSSGNRLLESFPCVQL